MHMLGMLAYVADSTQKAGRGRHSFLVATSSVVVAIIRHGKGTIPAGMVSLRSLNQTLMGQSEAGRNGLFCIARALSIHSSSLVTLFLGPPSSFKLPGVRFGAK